MDDALTLEVELADTLDADALEVELAETLEVELAETLEVELAEDDGEDDDALELEDDISALGGASTSSALS